MVTRQKSAQETSSKTAEIQPAKGKLGIMIPGMGAVATTFVAGVEAVRKGLASPFGSLTQMGTIRLGKRTDGRSPKVKEFVPLAGLDLGGASIRSLTQSNGSHLDRKSTRLNSQSLTNLVCP